MPNNRPTITFLHSREGCIPCYIVKAGMTACHPMCHPRSASSPATRYYCILQSQKSMPALVYSPSLDFFQVFYTPNNKASYVIRTTPHPQPTCSVTVLLAVQE